VERYRARREIIAMSRCARWFAHSLDKPPASLSRARGWRHNDRIALR
jgi:hypothetical protein